MYGLRELLVYLGERRDALEVQFMRSPDGRYASQPYISSSYGHLVTVVPEYFSNLDANQMRMDQLQRPELSKGTVDFALPSSSTSYDAPHPPPRLIPSTYSPLPPPLPTSRRKPEPMHVLFVFDVSIQAQQSGLLKAACDAVRGVLYGGEVEGVGRVEPCFPASCSVGIITYDNAVHFYDLSVCLVYQICAVAF